MALGFLYGAGGSSTPVNVIFGELLGLYTAPSLNTQDAKDSTITSGVVDATTKLRFYFTHYAGTYAANFTFNLKISTDAQNWVTVYTYAASGNTTPSLSGDIDLSAYVGNKLYVRAELLARSNGAAQGNLDQCIIGHFSS